MGVVVWEETLHNHMQTKYKFSELKHNEGLLKMMQFPPFLFHLSLSPLFFFTHFSDGLVSVILYRADLLLEHHHLFLVLLSQSVEVALCLLQLFNQLLLDVNL